MADNMVVGKSSPYQILEGIILQKDYPGVKKGISPHRLAHLYKTQELSETSEYILGCLYEFTYLTGHIVSLCFLHPSAGPQLRKIRRDGKNPYVTELKYLMRIGAVQRFSFHVTPEGQKKGYYVYSLTPGAWQWANERFYASRRFIPQRQNAGNPSQPTDIPYPKLIAALAFNQFHLSMLTHHAGRIAGIYQADSQNNDKLPCKCVLYSLHSGHSIFFFCWRKFMADCQGAVNKILLQLDKLLMLSGSRLSLIVIAVESIEAAYLIYMQLCDKVPIHYLGFCTDVSTKDGGNPLDGIIRYLGKHSIDYEVGAFIWED